MKQVFFVHSNITFLIAHRYILDKEIRPEDILFVLCGRFPRIPEGYDYTNTLFSPDDFFANGSTRVWQNYNLLKGRSNVRSLECRINERISNDLFTLFLSSTTPDVVSVVVTMKNCIGYYILEEGLASYCTTLELRHVFKGVKYFLVRAKHIAFERVISHLPVIGRFYALRGRWFNSRHEKFIGTVASSKRAFPDIGGEHFITSSPFQRIELTRKPDLVISIDAGLHHIFGENFPDKLFQFFADFIKGQKYESVAFKFHPDYLMDCELSSKYRDGIKSLLPEGTYELPKDYILENLFYSYEIDFLSDISSVGIYAKNFGRHCYSYAYIIPELYPNTNYRKLIVDNISQICQDSYEYLELSGKEYFVSSHLDRNTL